MKRTKIDRRKSYYVVLDTETANGILDEKGNLVPKNNLVYDLGFAVVDNKGKVYEEYSFVIYEVFFEMADVMQSAYYADKIENYLDDIDMGIRKVVRYETARRILRDCCERYKVKAIMAHNAYFDYSSVNATERYLTKSKSRYFYPYGVELWDTLAMARSIFGKSPIYRQWCEENGYMTKRNQPRYTAEIVYRYITGDKNFVESHTGLEDVMIERKIFAHCMKQHKPMNKRLFKEKS